MAPKKPVKPTKLQVKAAQKNKVLTGPKGSKPQGTTTNRVRTQGGTTMSKPAPSAGRRINPKAAKPAPAKPPAKPARPSIGNVRGPARSARPTAPKPSTPSGGGRNLFGGAGNKSAAIKQADGQKAPKPAFRTSRAPLAGTTFKPNRASLGNVKPGPAAAAAPRQQAQAQGQANVKAAQERRANIAKVQKDLRGQVGRAVSILTGPAAVARQAIAESVAPRPTAKGTLSSGGAQGPAMPKRLEQQGLAAQERKARAKNEARKKSTGSSAATPNTAASFDDAFKDARRAKVKSFTWRGKKYTTEIK